MKRLLKITVVLITICVVVTAVLVVAALYLPDSELVRTQVEAYFKEVTGKNVKLGHMEMSASFPRVVRIAVNDVTVTDASGNRLLSVEKVDLSPSPGALLQRRLFVESVTLRGLRTAIVRGADGRIIGPFSGGRSKVAGQPAASLPEPATAPAQWSIKRVELIGGELDWIDRLVTPGKELAVRIKGLGGSITAAGEGRELSMDLSGTLYSGEAKQGPVKLTGRLTLAPDLTALEVAVPKLALESCDLTTFGPYLPPNAVNPAFRVMNASVEANWKKGQASILTFQLSPKEEEGSARKVEVSGELTVSPDWSVVQSAKMAVKGAGIPLKTLAPVVVVPADLPLDLTGGTLGMDLDGKFTGPDDWEFGGTASVEKAALKGAYRELAKEVSVDAQVRMDPEQLRLDKVRISGKDVQLSAVGSVTKPLSKHPTLDFGLQTTLKTGWIKALGIALPPATKIEGTAPVKGKLSGTLADLKMEVRGDLQGISVGWDPFFEKPTAQKGEFTASGRLVGFKGAPHAQRVFDGTVAAKVSGIRVRFSDKGKWLEGATLEMASKQKAGPQRIDVENVSFSVVRAENGQKLVTASGNVSDVLSTAPRFDVKGSAVVDNEFLDMIGPRVWPLQFSGTIPVSGSYAGTESAGAWSVDMSLDHAGLEVNRATTNISPSPPAAPRSVPDGPPAPGSVESGHHLFAKAPGSPGGLKASGRLSAKGIELDKGQFTLGRLSVSGKGTIMDAAGKPGPLTLEFPKTDTRFLRAYFPGLRPYRLSGPAEGSVNVKTTDKGSEIDGTLKLLSFEFRPEKSGIALAGVKGSVDFTSSSVKVDITDGNVEGLVQGPVKLQGDLSDIESPQTMKGSFKVAMGQGRINAETLRGIMVLITPLLKQPATMEEPMGAEKVLDFDSMTADLVVKGDAISTDNLLMVGPLAKLGAIGKMPLNPARLDLLAMFKTKFAVRNSLGKLPGVGKVLKQGRDLLKITGLDKELGRIGINVPDSDTAEDQKRAEPEAKPLTLILKIDGPVSGPKVYPVLQMALDPETMDKLNALIK